MTLAKKGYHGTNSMVTQFIDWLWGLTGATGRDDSDNHRQAARQEIIERLGNSNGDVAEIVDYYIADVSETLFSSDVQVAFQYDSPRYGTGEFMLDPPERDSTEDGLSEFEEFMRGLGIGALDDLDAALGQEVSVEVNGGTLDIDWDDLDGDGAVYENAAEDGSDPVLADGGEPQTLGDQMEATPLQDDSRSDDSQDSS